MAASFAKGDAVLVLSGRGAGKIAAVVEDLGARILIANGRRIKAAHPKAKNPKHLKKVGEIEGFCARERETGISDPFLKKALRPFQQENREEQRV